MKKILVQIASKEALLHLKKFGESELVSASSSIYLLNVEPSDISIIEAIDGVICVEEDDSFDYQVSACI